MRELEAGASASALRSARAAALASFAIMGAAGGVWVACIPSIKHQLNLSDALVGIALFAIPLATIVMLMPAGALVDRFGSGPVARAGIWATALSLLLPGWAPNLASLFLALLAFGASLCVLNVAMNAHAVRVERGYGRPLMASFHAAYSVFAGIGAALGGLSVALGAGPGLTLVFAAALLGSAGLIACRPLVRASLPPRADQHTREEKEARVFAWRIVYLGLLALCGALTEGAVADWSGIYLSSNLNVKIGVAASGFTVFSLAIAVGRSFGDRLARRFGPSRMVRSGALLAATGLGAALISENPIAGVLGFAAMGIGLSCLVPQVMTTTGNIDPVHSGKNIARVGSLSTIGNLTGPILIGAVAGVVGLSSALWIPVALSLVIAACASAVAPAGTRPAAVAPRN